MFRFILLFSLFINSFYPYAKRDVRGESTEGNLQIDGKINISLNKKLFSEKENIILNVHLENLGEDPVKFFLSSKKFLTYRIVIKDSNNRFLPMNEEMMNETLSDKNLILNEVGTGVKEIILHKDESFTNKINLSKYFRFEPDMKYFVTVYIYPNVEESPDSFLKSENTEYFKIQMSKQENYENNFPDSNLESEGVSPEEVIYLFLGSEMTENWTNHFKWIDFSEYIFAYNIFGNEYSNATGVEKDRIIDEFKKYLTERKAGKLKFYRIEKSQKDESVSDVVVYVERVLNNSLYRYEYTYTLKNINSRSGYWKITNLIAKVKR